MKGERGVEAPCLLCDAIIRPRAPVRTRQGQHQTSRTITRHAAREHVVAHHPELSPRQISLVLDAIVDGTPLPSDILPFFAVRERISLTIQNSATVREDDCGRSTKRRGGSSQ